jgi:circadian clock protein KaiB
MAKGKKDTTVEQLEKALAAAGEGKYVLRLYVTGTTEKSLRAIENLKKLCDRYLEGRCEVEVIDIYQQPIFAKDGQIVAAPTLVKELPPPVRKFIGDLSNTERILAGLDLRSESEAVEK